MRTLSASDDQDKPQSTVRAVSPAGIALIQRFEGFSSSIYTCPGGHETVGWGHRVRTGEKIETPLSRERALALLQADLAPIEALLDALFPHLAQGQFDACASLAFNIGLTAFRCSTLMAKVAVGDMAGAAAQFRYWNKSSGRVLPGLIKRRAAERALFLGGS